MSLRFESGFTQLFTGRNVEKWKADSQGSGFQEVFPGISMKAVRIPDSPRAPDVNSGYHRLWCSSVPHPYSCLPFAYWVPLEASSEGGIGEQEAMSVGGKETRGEGRKKKGRGGESAEGEGEVELQSQRRVHFREFSPGNDLRSHLTWSWSRGAGVP